MMDAYGIKNGDDINEFINNKPLQSISFTFSLDEIDEMIQFLTYAKKSHAEEFKKYGRGVDHTHLQDYFRMMGKENPPFDIVIYTFNEQK